jgi:hypothetical protein
VSVHVLGVIDDLVERTCCALRAATLQRTNQNRVTIFILAILFLSLTQWNTAHAAQGFFPSFAGRSHLIDHSADSTPREKK